MGGDRHGRGWRYDTEDAERAIVRRKVGRPAGLGGVPPWENQRERVSLGPRSDGSAWFRTVGGGVVTAVPGAGSGVLGDVDVHLGSKGDGCEDGVGAMGESIGRVVKRVSHDGGHVVHEHGLRPGVRLV